MVFRPRRLISTAVLLVLAIFFLVGGHGGEYFGIFLLFLGLFLPIRLYQGLRKMVHRNSQFTDPKTLEFSPSRLVVTGPDWRSELPWTKFHGFSEDAAYFYLHLSDSGFASVIPKSAFTFEQQEKFRQYAKSQFA